MNNLFGRLNLKDLKEVGNYFEYPDEFINLMMVCKKFRLLADCYEYNPIQDWRIFHNITEQRFYEELSLNFDEREYGKLPRMKKYTYVLLISHLNSLKLKNEANIDSINIHYDTVDCEHFGMKIPSHIHKLSPKCFTGGISPEIKKYSLPPHIWTIGQQCFNCCYDLKEIIFTNPCFYLPPHAFDRTKHLTKIVLKGIDEIFQNTFEYCESLQEIYIPSTITKIGDFAFTYCLKLANIDIPTTVESIGIQCFHKCTSLRSIRVPTQMTTIPHMCFAYCSSLTKITLSHNVNSFQDGAFMFCSSLQDILIPSALTSIGCCCFIGCNSMRPISFEMGRSLKKVGKDSLLFKIKESDIKKEGDGSKRYYFDLSLFTHDSQSELLLETKEITNPLPIKEIYPRSFV